MITITLMIPEQLTEIKTGLKFCFLKKKLLFLLILACREAPVFHRYNQVLPKAFLKLKTGQGALPVVREL